MAIVLSAAASIIASFVFDIILRVLGLHKKKVGPVTAKHLVNGLAGIGGLVAAWQAPRIAPFYARDVEMFGTIFGITNIMIPMVEVAVEKFKLAEEITEEEIGELEEEIGEEELGEEVEVEEEEKRKEAVIMVEE